MPLLLALWACDADKPDADDSPTEADTDSETDTDSDTDTDTDTDSDTDADTDTSATGSSGATADTGSPTFDTAGPACAGTPPTDTGLLSDTGLPLQSCDLIPPVAPVSPGPVVSAMSIYRARIDGNANQTCGFAIVGLGDNDGDGLGELAVGCPSFSLPGEVWVLSGSQTGLLGRGDALSILTQGSASHYNEEDGGRLEVGAVTGLAARDLIVGGTSDNATYVLPLPVPLGTMSLDTATAVVEPLWFRRMSGVPSIGDYDGDGHRDVAVSGREPEVTDVPAGLGDGGISVFLGPLAGTLDPVLDADVQLEVSALDKPWGVLGPTWSGGPTTRAFAGDFDGDGRSDILLGGNELANYAPPASMQYGPTATDDHGGLALFMGGPLGRRTAGDATAILYGTCFANITGELQSPVGDVTGDCVPDFVTSSSGSAPSTPLDAGAVFVLSGDKLGRARGHVALTRIADAVLFGESSSDTFAPVGYLGDLNQDGHDDLVVGAPNASGDTGRVYLFLGPVSGWIHAADADLVIQGGALDVGFGSAVRGAGDLDGDGVIDLIVGSWLSRWGGNDSGSVWVFSGADLLAAM